jgi:hypothetical protein
MAFVPIDPNKAEVRITGTSPDYGLDFYIPKGERGEVGPTGPQGPAVPTNLSIGTIEIGPAAPGTVGPQGLQGLKGDPGGLVDGTVLGDVSLNTIVVSGIYRQSSSAATVGTLANNYPYPGAYGVLVVMKTGASDVTQTFYNQSYNAATDARITYSRNYSNGVWSPWAYHTTTRVDQTAGRAIYQWDYANNREQLIWGDTGVRQVDGWVNNTRFDNTGTARTITARRVGSTVQIGGQLLATATVAANDIMFTIPTGFRPDRMVEQNAIHTTTGYPVRVSIGNGTADARYFTYTNQTPPGGFVATNIVQFSMTFTTTDAWPTTLPGVALGSIPST